DDGGEREGADAEQLQRQHRLDGPAFHGHERDGEAGAQHGQADDLRRAPAPGGAAEGGDEDEAGGDGGDEEGAEVVDDVPGGPAGQVQHRRDDGEGDDPDRHVDVEHPAPAQVFGEQSAEQRAEHAGGAEDRAEQALVAPAFAGRDEVADDRHGQHDQPAAAQPLQGAVADQLRHVLGRAAQHGAHQEDHDGDLEQLLAPVLVAQLAPQGGRGGRGQQIGGDHPGQVLQAAEVADDGGQRGGDDGLIECGEQQTEEQGTDRQDD